MRPFFKQLKNSPNWKLSIFWSGNVKTAIASLRRNRWRSFFTMMGVIIGVVSVVTVVSLGEGLKHQITGQIDRLGHDVLTIRPGRLVDRGASGQIGKVNLRALFNPSTLTDRDIRSLNQIDQIQSVVPINFVTSSAKGDSGSSDDLSVIGSTSAMADVLQLKTDFGAFFGRDDQASAVIGPAAARQLFHSNNPFAHSVNIGNSSFIVRGVLKENSGGLLSVSQADFDSTIIIPYFQAKKLTGGQTNILEILAKTEPAADIDQVTSAIKRKLIRNHNGQENFTVLKQNELRSVSNQVIDSLTSFITAIAAISLLVGGIGIMDIMLVAVSERTREIGIRKAIGATNRQILNQFLTEGLVLSVGGGLAGLILAFFINFGLRLYTDLQPVITWPIMLLSILVSLAVGIVFSGAPALKAARKLPVEAFRSE